MKQLDGAFSSDARRFNSKQSRDSLISIKLSYRPGIVPIPLPAQATDVMTQEFTCEECSCRYSSVGAIFFCPACGHNSVLDTFVNSVETVKETIAALPMIRKAIESSSDVNVAEDSIRHICENGLVKIVSSFQRYAESCFQKLQNASQFNLRLNLFQNLDDSDAVWRDATSTGYTDILTDEQYSSLIMYFQQRHLLAHRDGVVDQLYLDRTGDHRLAAGQRLIVAESSISDLASVIEKLAAGIEEIT